MNTYPDAVAKIARDYMERLRIQLRQVPAGERDEFLREIESHLYEAYQEAAGTDEVAKILTVLRNLGEPADVVAERLPATLVRSGAKRNVPLHMIGGILIAIFGIPLGFGGVAVLIGMLAGLAGLVIGYYATVGAVFLTGALFLLMGLTRSYQPGLWDRLIEFGVIHIDADLAGFLNQLSSAGQGFFMIVVASVFIAAGLGMLALGKHLVRGLRFMFSLVFDWLRKFGQRMRRRLRAERQEGLPLNQKSYAK